MQTNKNDFVQTQGQDLAALEQVFKLRAEPLPRPFFFRGEPIQPQLFATLLQVLTQVVQARFYRPDLWRLLDPVLTCTQDRLLLECFSSCSAVYARLELSRDFFKSYDLQGCGTTHVDFGLSFQNHLRQLDPCSHALFEIASAGVVLASEGNQSSEARAKLPASWKRAFAQSQALLRHLTAWHHLKGIQGRAFVMGLPQSRQDHWLLPQGKSLKSSRFALTQGQAIQVKGIHRLCLLKPLMPYMRDLTIYSHSEGTSFWHLKLPEAQLSLGLSRSLSHGFGGESETLRSQSLLSDQEGLYFVQRWLMGVDSFSLSELAAVAEISLPQALAFVDQLALDGVLGFDLPRQHYFYRRLPFSPQTHQPLLQRQADALESYSQIELIACQHESEGLVAEGWAPGRQGQYRLGLTLAAGHLQSGHCSCKWFTTHQLRRGPCKHLLMLRYYLENNQLKGRQNG